MESAQPEIRNPRESQTTAVGIIRAQGIAGKVFQEIDGLEISLLEGPAEPSM
jgi:hypothetical protein